MSAGTLTAAATAHRACCGTEHDPANGKLHGYCVVCGVDWPCETAQAFLVKPTPAPIQVVLRPDPVLCFLAGVLCTIGAWSLQLDLWGMEESVRRMVNEWAPAWRTVPEALGMIALGAWGYRRQLRP